MFDLFKTKKDEKYIQALKWSERAQTLYKAPVGRSLFGNAFEKDGTLSRIARLSVIWHPCTTEEKQSLGEFLKAKGVALHEYYEEIPFMERLELYREWSSRNVSHKPTEWGKFLKRRRKSLNKDFPPQEVHRVLIEKMTKLNDLIRHHIEDIRRGNSFNPPNFWELIVLRDNVENIQEFYYDLLRDLAGEGWDASVDTGELIGNDGSVPYSYGWVLDYGLWQVFNHFGVEPKNVILDETDGYGWLGYKTRLNLVGHWWVKDWDPNFMDTDDSHCMLSKDELYLKIA